MRIDILGVDGGSRRDRIVLTVLALADGVVAAESLAAAVWGDDPPPTWPVALRGVVRGLRARLGAQVIGTAAPGYRLGADVLVDLTEARQAVRAATDLLARGRAGAALELVAPVAEISGAQLLPGEDAAWLAAHRAGVDALAARALELVVASAGRAGKHDQAVIAARRAVAADDLDEPAHRALITALAGAGDRAGAVRAYEACRARLGDQLGVEPSPETVEAYLAVLTEQPAPARARLPQFASSFVGRAAETTSLAALLAGPGLVTVQGRGGVGKSRLAQHVARADETFAGGRMWVSLAAVPQDALVGAAVALEVAVGVGAEDESAAIAASLAPLGRALLVLDGCELVVDGVASLVAELRDACPDLVVLATSRAPVGVDGERVLAIDTLASTDVQLRLLRDRVAEAGGTLDVDRRLAPHVRALLARCDGLPLALELVAAQLSELPVGDLLDHLAEVGVAGDDRLRSVARSSYALLAADEAALFRAFAVLDGWVGVSLVRQVAAALGVAPIRVVRILRELAARGLLSVDRSGARWRYQQDDDLHRYAGELLAARDERPAAYKALADAVAAVLPADARAAPGAFAGEVTAMLGGVRSLFAAGLAGQADTGRCLELAFRLHRYFATTNVAEGRFWLRSLLDAATDAGEWSAYAMYALGYLGYWAGDVDDAVARLTACVELFGATPTPYVARALTYLAGMLDDLDRGAEAVDYVHRAIGAAAPFDIDLQVSTAMGTACVLAERGDPAAARHAADAIALCHQGGSIEQLAITLPTAAMVCWQVGDYARAGEYVAQAWPHHGGGPRIARVVLLSAAAGLAFADGDLDGAIDLARRGDAEGTELGVDREMPLIRAVLARALHARGDTADAVAAALGGLDAAVGLDYAYPLAVCFETVAVIGAGEPGADRAAGLAGLLAAAAVLRERGSRPALPALAGAVARLRERLGPADPIPVAQAVALCPRLLAGAGR